MLRGTAACIMGSVQPCGAWGSVQSCGALGHTVWDLFSPASEEHGGEQLNSHIE